MPTQNTNGTALPLVVGTIHSPGALQRALRLQPGEVDVLELRVDHFADDPEALLRVCHDLPAPLILTVRHPNEGGAGNLHGRERRQLNLKFLRLAQYLDVEVRSLKTADLLIAIAQDRGAQVIVSDHHFRRVPSGKVLQERWQRARDAGADIVKVAGRVETASDLERLGALFKTAGGTPLSLMGMGPLGKVSRLLFARLGSCLNYGYLHEPQVPGQWEATQLKERVRELFGE